MLGRAMKALQRSVLLKDVDEGVEAWAKESFSRLNGE